MASSSAAPAGASSSGSPAAAPVTSTTTPDEGPGEPPAPSSTASIRRANDTVNPIAVGGEIDIQLSAGLAQSLNVNYELLNLDGSSAVGGRVMQLNNAGGAAFPQTPSLRKLKLTGVSPGRYLLRVKGNYFNTSIDAFDTQSADLEVDLSALHLHLASLSYASSIVINGSSRHLPFELTSIASGILYLYPLHQRAGVCPVKSEAELQATSDVSAQSISLGSNQVLSSAMRGVLFADADTLCAQFVRSEQSYVEAPYTFNVRWVAAPASGQDLVLDLEADVSTVPKTALGLVSLPRSSSNGLNFDWLERRQLFAAGDVHQQSTAASAKIALAQQGLHWVYKVTSPTASDHPFFVATVEGRPPIVFYAAR